MATIPILDLRALESDRTGFLFRLRRVARDPGFFTLIGHGVDPELESQVVAEAERFFALPEPAKLAVQMVHSPHFRGYNCAGAELTRGRPDWREQFDVHAERPALPQVPGAPAWTRLQGPNLWPAEQPSLRPALLAWQAALTTLGHRLLRAFAASLEQPEDVFDALLGDAPGQNLKLIRYPAVADGEAEQGVGPHKDSGLLTFVRQDGVGGLQAETPAGWAEAPPIPGSFVVNIGELLELATNGYLRATVHRVLSPRGRDRLSIAFFLGARLDAVVQPLALPPHLAAEAHGPEADPANPLFRQVGENVLKGRLRSHPDVAERHYADLLTKEPA